VHEPTAESSRVSFQIGDRASCRLAFAPNPVTIVALGMQDATPLALIELAPDARVWVATRELRPLAASPETQK
jgi:hypothetical protein